MRFEDAVAVAVKTLREELAGQAAEITLVRDANGYITAVLADTALAPSRWSDVAGVLDQRLERFSPGSTRVLLRQSDLIDPSDVLDSPDRIQLAEVDCWLVDRLLTNQDWLRRPTTTRPIRQPLATAFSLKGGVGRSTTVAVWAWHLAREGKRVTVVDLDLEAPGVGSLLLADLPDYGGVDWLAESLLGSPSRDLLEDCLGVSRVAEDAPGTVFVLPAFGRRTREYVAKVGRIYMPAVARDGSELGLAERLRDLVEAIAARRDPADLVLLDSRAGLHDIGAAAVTQLGAEVFLFGRDEPQSWQAYRLLFEHLARARSVEFGMPEEDLRWRMKMVAAQVDKTEDALASWVDASYSTWSALYDGDAEAGDELAGSVRAQTFERDELSAPHYPLPIYFDSGLRGISLSDSSQRPVWNAIEAAFGAFLTEASARLFAEPESDA